MTTTIHINDYTNDEWADKAGFSFLQIIVDTNFELPLSDIMAIMKYIKRNAMGTQMGVLFNRMLNETSLSLTPPTFADFELQYKNLTIEQRKILARTFNTILQNNKEDIKNHIEYKKRMDFAKIVQSLGEVMQYIGNNEISDTWADVIRESLKLIEKGLPRKE